MIGDRALVTTARGELSRRDEMVEQLAVVDDLEVPPERGYSLASELKQWGQVAMTFFTPALSSVSIFIRACSW